MKSEHYLERKQSDILLAKDIDLIRKMNKNHSLVPGVDSILFS